MAFDAFTDTEHPQIASWEVFRHLEATLARRPPAPRRLRSQRPRSTRSMDATAGGGLTAPLPGRFEVVIAHISPIVAEGLLSALTRHTDVEAAICANKDDLRARVSSSPCLVFSDYATAVSEARMLATTGNATSVWACVTARDSGGEIRDALNAGVSAYILADSGIEDYLECVRSIGRGSKYICPRAEQQLVQVPERPCLSVREAEVLRLVVDGCSNQTISQQLDITISTVKAHMGKILAKLGARSRTQAASMARAMGILGHRAVA